MALTLDIQPPKLSDTEVLQTKWTLWQPADCRYVKFEGLMRETIGRRGWDQFWSRIRLSVPRVGPPSPDALQLLRLHRSRRADHRRRREPARRRFLGGIIAAEPTPMPAQPDQREVWVPSNKLKEILAKHPIAVVLSPPRRAPRWRCWCRGLTASLACGACFRYPSMANS